MVWDREKIREGQGDIRSSWLRSLLLAEDARVTESLENGP
jgi:hypothetical protein